MVARAIDWPVALLPRMVEIQPDLQSRSGGLSMVGSEQITVSPAGRWKAKVSVSVRGEISNLALRAFVASMEGRAGTVLVPKWERFRPRDLNGRKVSQVPGVGYAEGFNFDLSGFGQSPAIYATVRDGVGLGVTRLVLDLVNGEGPRPGNYFGIGQRIYRCQSVWQTEEDASTQVQFWPRLREAVSAGVPAILDRPVCLMRFANDDEGQGSLSRAGSGMVEFQFVEAI